MSANKIQLPWRPHNENIFCFGTMWQKTNTANVFQIADLPRTAHSITVFSKTVCSPFKLSIKVSLNNWEIFAFHLLLKRLLREMQFFYVFTPIQTSQQTYLAPQMDSLVVDICCKSETRIQDPNNIIHLSASGVASVQYRCIPGDETGRSSLESQGWSSSYRSYTG